MRRTGAILIALAVVLLTSLGAQSGGPWFATPLPPPVSDPRKPVMKYDDVFAPVPAAFPHRPGRGDELLDGAALKKDHRRIVDFSLESLAAGDTVWGRRAATPAFMRTIEWTVNAFKAAGLEDAAVDCYTVQGRMWVAQSWRVRLGCGAAVGARRRAVALQTAVPPPGGVAI